MDPRPSSRVPFVDYDETRAVCSDCGRNFPSEESLAEHQRDTHAPAAERHSPTRSAPKVACAVCGGRFPSVAALAAHNRAAHTR